MRSIGGSFTPAKPSSQNPAKTLISLFHLAETLPLAQQLQAQIIVHGLSQSSLFGSSLSNAYIQLGCFQFASKAFSSITDKTTHSWNTILSGFFREKLFPNVLQLFKQMRTEGCSVDSVNLAFAIKSCIGLSRLQDGKLVHALAVKSALEKDPYVVPSMIKLYTELGCLQDASKVFDEMSDWNPVILGAMMKGYLKSSEENKVFELFRDMRISRLELDPFTSECLVQACGNVSASKEGKSVHGLCLKQDFISCNIYLPTSLLDMYLKCGLLDYALRLFKEVPQRDVVLWTAMVAGFVKNGRALEAVALFRQMLDHSISPNKITLANIVLACSHLGSLQLGKSIHGYMVRNGFEMDEVNYTSLIDMYAKCGLVNGALSVFKGMATKNVFSWSAMINGFGINGCCDEAIAFFDRMRLNNQMPNTVTFVSLLSACSHSGRVEEGWSYFKSMTRDYGVTPTAEHYACMVDLLGRSGKIEDAFSLIKDMPIEAGPSAWGALLSACRTHKQVELAEKVAEKLLPLEPDKSAVYVLLCDIYGNAGLWEKVRKIRTKIGKNGLQKIAGTTSIEVNEKQIAFRSKDKLSYKDMEDNAIWTCLQQHTREFGYVPSLSFAH